MLRNALPTLFLLLTTSCFGSEIFDFVSDGEVLATLELRQLPATHLDVIRLSFTERGEDLFGFGPVYQGDFDIIGPEISARFVLSEVDGGLAGLNADNVHSIAIDDLNPPPSTVPEFGALIIGFAVGAADTLPDRLVVIYTDPSTVSGLRSFRQEGQFLPVPEPSFHTSLLSVLGGVGLVMRRRR